MEQVRSVLAWLKTLAEPGKEETVLLIESTMNSMSQHDTPPLVFPGAAMSGRHIVTY
jgi:hypothetical protein